MALAAAAIARGGPVLKACLMAENDSVEWSSS